MGVQSLLVGYIKEAWPGLAGGGHGPTLDRLRAADREISAHNERVLESLPAEDTWPPLSRPMFGWAPVDAPMVVYKNRLIHFAASFKQPDWELRDWLEKFEGLLRRLYWESVYVRFEGAYLGIHEFTWRPTEAWVKELCQGLLVPIAEWSFTSSMPAGELEGLRE